MEKVRGVGASAAIVPKMRIKERRGKVGPWPHSFWEKKEHEERSTFSRISESRTYISIGEGLFHPLSRGE